MEQRRCAGCMAVTSGPYCQHCGRPAEMDNEPHQLPVGTVLRGQYMVGRVLGQGGFGITYLAEEESLSMSNIARMMGHSTAAATGMVDKLQELGHLKRYTAAADRRKIMVRITEQGLDLVERMRGNIARDIADIMAREDNASRTGQARTLFSRRKKTANSH